MSDSTILQEADAIAGKDRSRDYGHPYDNHKLIADYWNLLLGKKLSVPIAPREVALMMVCLKLAREGNTPKRDNLVDIAGYVKCVDMIDVRNAEVRTKKEELKVGDRVTLETSNLHGVVKAIRGDTAEVRWDGWYVNYAYNMACLKVQP